MAEHIVINGLKIVQNMGLEAENTINYIKSELTTGKNFYRNIGDKNESFKFKSILTPDQYDTYESAYWNLVELSKKQSIAIIIGKKQFYGIVESLTASFPVEDYREYDWVVSEQEPFVPIVKEFDTFNYKPANVMVKNVSTTKKTYPSWINDLLKCNPVKSCNKYKVKCVYLLQDFLRLHKFYLKYVRDGQFCIYTEQELKRWQTKHKQTNLGKKLKLKATGKFDTITKKYLKEYYKIKPASKGKNIKLTSPNALKL